MSGIGNAYSDEILHAAQLSPILLTHKLKSHDWQRLFEAARDTLQLWVDRLQARRTPDFLKRSPHFARVWRSMDAMENHAQDVEKRCAHSLCGQRNELLCTLPDGWQSPCGSEFVAALKRGLAAHPGRTRGSETTLIFTEGISMLAGLGTFSCTLDIMLRSTLLENDKSIVLDRDDNDAKS